MRACFSGVGPQTRNHLVTKNNGHVWPPATKFHILDLAQRDRALTPQSYRVLSCIWGHQNSKTGLCFPSDERIAQELGINRRTVLRARKLLREAGYLSWEKDLGGTNHYSFDCRRMNSLLDEQTLREDQRRELRLRRRSRVTTEVSQVTAEEATDLTRGGVTGGSEPPVTVLPHESFKVNPSMETPQNISLAKRKWREGPLDGLDIPEFLRRNR